MDVKTFEDMVCRRCPPEVRKESRQVAIDFFKDEGKTQQSDVSACIQLAGRFEAYYASSQGTSEKTKRWHGHGNRTVRTGHTFDSNKNGIMMAHRRIDAKQKKQMLTEPQRRTLHYTGGTNWAGLDSEMMISRRLKKEKQKGTAR
jgi:hypothetical protein